MRISDELRVRIDTGNDRFIISTTSRRIRLTEDEAGELADRCVAFIRQCEETRGADSAPSRVHHSTVEAVDEPYRTVVANDVGPHEGSIVRLRWDADESRTPLLREWRAMDIDLLVTDVEEDIAYVRPAGDGESEVQWVALTELVPAPPPQTPVPVLQRRVRADAPPHYIEVRLANDGWIAPESQVTNYACGDRVRVRADADPAQSHVKQWRDERTVLTVTTGFSIDGQVVRVEEQSDRFYDHPRFAALSVNYLEPVTPGLARDDRVRVSNMQSADPVVRRWSREETVLRVVADDEHSDLVLVEDPTTDDERIGSRRLWISVRTLSRVSS
jgi:hypothetical protein